MKSISFSQHPLETETPSPEEGHVKISLPKQFAEFLLAKRLATIELLSDLFATSPAVSRTTLARFKQTPEGASLTAFRRRDGQAFYFLDDPNRSAPGFVMTCRDGLATLGHEVGAMPTSVSSRYATMAFLGLVEEGSNVERVFTRLSDGDEHPSSELAQVCGRESLNMPVTLRHTLPKLFPFGLELTERRSTQVRKGHPERIYRLNPLAIPEEDPQRLQLELHRRFAAIQTSLFQKVLGILHDAGEAEDIIRKAFDNIFPLCLEHGDTTWMQDSYLFRTCTNLALNRLRDQNVHARKEVSHADRFTPSSIPTPEEALIQKQEIDSSHRVLHQSLAQLPAAQQEAVTLYYFEHMSYQEIGLRLGIDPVTAGTRISRAKSKLRELLKDNPLVRELIA